MSRRRSLRENMFRWQRGRCWWCARRCVLVRGSGSMPENAATIDHVYSKLDPRRAKANQKVMACYQCNRQRNEKEVRSLTKEELWRRSGRKPSSPKEETSA